MAPDAKPYVLYYSTRSRTGLRLPIWLRGDRYATATDAHEAGAAWLVATLFQGSHDLNPRYKVLKVRDDTK